MRLTIGQWAGKIARVSKKSKIDIYRKATGKWEKFVKEENPIKTNDSVKQSPIEDTGSGKMEKRTGIGYRENEMEIQMLSAPLYEQVFRNTVPRTSETDAINR